jgi:tRNA uridine 5-carbamoylmethylation protein Kti12
VYIDDVCKALLTLQPSEDFNASTKVEFSTAKTNFIVNLFNRFSGQYSAIEARVSTKKLTREKAEEKYVLLDTVQLPLVKRLWTEFQKVGNPAGHSNLSNLFDNVKNLPKTSAFILESIWPLLSVP